MRKFLASYFNDDNEIEVDEVEIDGPANPETIAKKITEGLNHYNGYTCLSYQIISWSLIEEN